MTHAGMILGTAAYMSPEQARGRVLDRRTDVWAFGCVLFEMLTGVRAFSGDDVTETLASIMKSDPPMARLPADTPAEIRRLLTRCLQKDRRLRLQHIGDARLELDDAAHPTAAPVISNHHSPSWVASVARRHGNCAGCPRRGTRARGLAACRRPCNVAAVRNCSAASRNARHAGRHWHRCRAAVRDFTGWRVRWSSSPTSEKGIQLWHRWLECRRRARPSRAPKTRRFRSGRPTASSIGFFADAKLKRIRVDGGPPIVVCDAELGRGGTWNRDNVIVFAPASAGAYSAYQRMEGCHKMFRRSIPNTTKRVIAFPFSCLTENTFFTPPRPAAVALL